MPVSALGLCLGKPSLILANQGAYRSIAKFLKLTANEISFNVLTPFSNTLPCKD